MRLYLHIESFKQAFESLKANKLRSFLASLGVVVGVSFVILMGWALSSLDNAVNDLYDSFGQDVMYVSKWDWAGGDNWEEERNRKPITMNQAKELIEKLPGIEFAYPMSWDNCTIKYGNSQTNAQVRAVGYQFAYTPTAKFTDGRCFTQTEENNDIPSIVLGSKLADAVFDGQQAVGKQIKIKGRNFTVVGVLKKQGNALDDSDDKSVYLSMKNYLSTFGNIGNRSFNIMVKVGSVTNMEQTRDEITGVFRSVRNLQPGSKNDFSINEVSAFKEQMSTIRTVVYSVGIGMTGLSFIVGIIGIMNIMFVSVSERIKEIGLRKALGAKKVTILLQFVVESSFLCVLGSLVSLAVCSLLVWIAVMVIQNFNPDLTFIKPYLSFDLFFIAAGISAFVGILAGLIPAIKAANLDPVEALRFE